MGYPSVLRSAIMDAAMGRGNNALIKSLRRWAGFAVSGALLLAAGAASAQTAPAEVVRILNAWGLMGTWAVDCARPVGQQWSRLRYVVGADGRAVREADFGNAIQNEKLDITGANIAKNGTLELTFYSPNGGQTRLLTLTKLPNKTIRSLAARVKDGATTVVNGRFTSTGNETPALQKCT